MAPDASLKTIDQLTQEIEAGLHERGVPDRQPANLYEPMRYTLRASAKRIRPLLVLMGYQAFSDQPTERVLEAALGVELLHNFTLIHDDIMDRAPTRRGHATVHEQWDTNVAILAGDGMFARAMSLIVGCEAGTAAMGEYIANVALTVCEGQAEDIDYTGTNNVTEQQYLTMIRKKTATLIGGSLRLGAMAAGAATASCDRLETYGQQTGIAFQLIDDYLDTYADQQHFGKQPGGDIVQNKNTYLWLRALGLASQSYHQELLSWTHVRDQDEAKVAAVRAMYDQLGVPEDTRQLIDEYYQEAQQAIAPLQDRPGIQQLTDYVDALKQRQH
jgi:geranylgeranyl diphosphate synthase type II